MEKIGHEISVKKNFTVDDTLALIVHAVNQEKKLGFIKEAIKLVFPSGKFTRDEFCKKIFEIYCRNVKYKLDKRGTEDVNTAALTFLEGQGDCKKAAEFLGSFLDTANIPFALKHVYYNDSDLYTHIYVVVPLDEEYNNYITLDPTNGCEYDKEVSFQKGTLYFLNGETMPLRMMGNSNQKPVMFTEDISSSCDNMLCGMEDISDSMLGANPANAAAHLSKLAPSPHLNLVLDKLKKGDVSVHKAIVHALAPNNPKLQAATVNIPINQQRGAFLELIKNNVNGLATQLATVLGTKPDALNGVWGIVGGDMAHLKQMIIDGAKHATTIEGPEYISGFWSKFLHGAASVLHAVAPVANAIFPGAGRVVEGIAAKAESIALSMPVHDDKGQLAPPPPLPPDLKGSNIPFGEGQMVHGSFATIPGFIFKTSLLINMYFPTHAGILGTIAISAPLLWYVVKKYKLIQKIKLWQI